MRLSIVIQAYNKEKYLPACLEGVLAEIGRSLDPASVEVIVVDNGGTGRIAEVARSFPGIRVMREPKTDLTRARRKGSAEARGEILAYVDADTRMPPGWITRMLHVLETDGRIVCVGGSYFYYEASPLEGALIAVGGFDTAIAFYGEDTNIARRLYASGKVKFLMHLRPITHSHQDVR